MIQLESRPPLLLTEQLAQFTPAALRAHATRPFDPRAAL
jgi:hypothetical protein